MNNNPNLSKLLNNPNTNRTIDSYFPPKLSNSSKIFKERKTVNTNIYSFECSTPKDNNYSSQQKSYHPLDQRLIGTKWDFEVHGIPKEQPKLGEEHDLISISKIKKKTTVVEDSYENLPTNRNRGFQNNMYEKSGSTFYNDMFNKPKSQFPIYQKQDKFSLSKKELSEKEEEEKGKRLLQFLKERKASRDLNQVSKDLNQKNIVAKDLNEKMIKENQEKEKRDMEIKNKLKEDTIKARMLEIAHKNREEQDQMKKIAKKVSTSMLCSQKKTLYIFFLESGRSPNGK
jgi:hypothetical protein